MRRLLADSDEVVRLWRVKQLEGFGGVTSDIYNPAVLWDIVIFSDLEETDWSDKSYRNIFMHIQL